MSTPFGREYGDDGHVTPKQGECSLFEGYEEIGYLNHASNMFMTVVDI